MAEDEAGLVSSAVAVSLLMLPTPSELSRLSREGWFKPAGKDRWRVVEIVQGMIRALQAHQGIATTQELIAVLEITGTRIGQLAAEGWFKPIAKNRWNRDEVYRGYLKFLKSDDRRSTKSAAENRVRDAKAREIEMRIAERERDLIRYEEAETALEAVVGMVRTEMGGVAARVTRDLPMRRAIEKAINEGLTRIVDRLAVEVAALQKGDGPAGAVEDFDA
jgi:hypothetical protein